MPVPRGCGPEILHDFRDGWGPAGLDEAAVSARRELRDAFGRLQAVVDEAVVNDDEVRTASDCQQAVQQRQQQLQRLPQQQQRQQQHHVLSFAYVNVDRKCGSSGSLAVLWSVVRDLVPDLGCLYVSELDGSREFFLYRHWPGDHSRAMGFLVARRLASRVSCFWEGRAGACRIHDAHARGVVDCSFVGWHGGHREMLWPSLADLRSVLRRCRSSLLCAVGGDSNIDWWDTLQARAPAPPFPLGPREPGDEEARAALTAVLAAARLRVAVPAQVVSGPGGPWDEFCAMSPVTRIPQGERARAEWPSLLDVAGLPVCASELHIAWHGAPADHAIAFFQLPLRSSRRRPGKPAWRCTEREDELRDRLAHVGFEYLNGGVQFEGVAEYVVKHCHSLKDKQSRVQRRAARVPLQAKTLWNRAACACDERRRKMLCQAGWELARKAQERAAGSFIRAKCTSGRVFARSKKLFPICAISELLPDGSARRDLSAVAGESAVKEEFCSRWQVGRAHRIEILHGLLAAYSGRSPCWSERELRAAFASIAHQGRVDANGESVGMWNAFFCSSPAAACGYFSKLAACDASARSSCVAARALGKTGERPLPAEIRVVLPLEARSQVLDALLANRLQDFLSSARFKRPWLWVGAQKGTQPMDLAWMLSQVIEKCLDDRSQGGLAQGDVQSYYDCLDVILCVRWLLEQPSEDVDPAVAIACLRWQLLPKVAVDAAIFTFDVGQRTGGAITGSRVAGALGRIPVEESLRHEEATLLQHGWAAGGRIFAAGCFVDNLYFVSKSLGGSLIMSTAVERRLRRRWLLRIKPRSRQAMPIAGSVEERRLAQFSRAWPDWRFSSTFRTLGMLLDNRGAVIRDFLEARNAVLGGMLRNFGSHVRRATSQATRLRLIERIARGPLDYRNSRWPISPDLSRRQDALQRRCISIACGCKRDAGEDIDSWQRRRSRQSGDIARSCGLWSARHARRVQEWRAHVERSADYGSPMADIWRWHDAAWRRAQRQRAGSGSLLAGRLGTRAITHVYTRWEDSLPDLSIPRWGARLADGSFLLR